MSNIVLLDTSSSMELPVGTKRRIDILARILEGVMAKAPNTRLFGFGSETVELENVVTDYGIDLPEPDGSTALAEALEVIAPLKPGLVIVISDGEPNDPKAAIAIGKTLGCRINTYYCGDEGNRAAIAFLRDLSLCSKGNIGRARIADLTKPEQIASELQLLLVGPSR